MELNRSNIDIVHLLLIGTAALLLFELLFIHTGLLIFIAICAFFVYWGKNTYYQTGGKLMFWLGLFFAIISILNTLAFRFILFATLIYFVYKWYQAKQQPTYYKPEFVEEQPEVGETVKRKVMFTNKWFGNQETDKSAYEWQDINIQSGLGDIIVDLNYTVIPKSEPVIVIRNVIGNVQIIVPYDVEVSIHHSVLLGSVDIFDYQEANAFNQTLITETTNYANAKQRVKILTSMVVGKIEVKRG